MKSGHESEIAYIKNKKSKNEKEIKIYIQQKIILKIFFQ